LRVWLFSLIFLLHTLSDSHASLAPEVKVLIGKRLKNILVKGVDLTQHVPLLNAKKTFSGRQLVNFNCEVKKSALVPQRPTLMASLSSPTGLVGWEDKHFQGELQLVAHAESHQQGCDLVNVVPMEAYLSTLLAKEMNAQWPIEALKAQAVAARTYAYVKMQQAENLKAKEEMALWDLESSEKDQVSGHFFDSTYKTQKAVRESQGEILVDKIGRPVMAFFHAKCGGSTLLPSDVWRGQVDGYQKVDCPFCHKHGRKPWSLVYSKTQFKQLLKKITQKNLSLSLPEGQLQAPPDDASAGEFRFYIDSKLYALKKAWFRNHLSREKIPSNHFKVKFSEAAVWIEGKGYGHGVGLCQLGALEMAKQGASYRQILAHYFPELSLKKLW
jgi:stage II sporulation protein D